MSEAGPRPGHEEMSVLMIVEQLRRSAAGGIGTYVRGLLGGLDDLAAEGETVPHIELVASRAPRGHSDPLAELGHPVHSEALPGPLLTRAWDRGLIRNRSASDILHATSLATMEPGTSALVVTVHDLLWRQLPDAYPARGRRWHEHALARAVRRATRFIVANEMVAGELLVEGAPPGSITVIPMGVDHLPPPDHDAATRLLARLGITGPFLLSVGTLEPRKNHERLLAAYRRVRTRLPEPWPLLMVGPSGWGRRVKPEEGVVFAGLVSPGELAAFYCSARLLAYVPLIEGFGLPPVEAMNCGIPVVASPLPSTGGAAFEVDPGSVESIAEGILQVATDDALRARLVGLGATRAAELRWASIARRHLAVWDAARQDRWSGADRG
jgi:glycosyltransferase involved in cell wall biosynthesis